MTMSTGTRMQQLGYRAPDPVPEPEHLVLVDYVSEGRIAVITLNRPHALNAVTTALAAQLIEILETISARASVRVAILTSAGDEAFSVGGDLYERKSMTQEQWLRQRQVFDRVLFELRQSRRPIFTAVHGMAQSVRRPRKVRFTRSPHSSSITSGKSRPTTRLSRTSSSSARCSGRTTPATDGATMTHWMSTAVRQAASMRSGRRRTAKSSRAPSDQPGQAGAQSASGAWSWADTALLYHDPAGPRGPPVWYAGAAPGGWRNWQTRGT